MKICFTSHADERRITRRIGKSEIKRCIDKSRKNGNVQNVGGLARRYSYRGIIVIAELIPDGHRIITTYFSAEERAAEREAAKKLKEENNLVSTN